MGRGFPDAEEIERNVKSRKIQVYETEREKKGEFEAVNLFKLGDFDAIVSDDRKFLKQLGRMGIPYLTPSSLIVLLLYKGKLSKEDALSCIERLRKYISE